MCIFFPPYLGKRKKVRDEEVSFPESAVFFLFLQKDDGINSILLAVLLALFADRTD